MTELQPDQIAAGAAVLAGLATNRLIVLPGSSLSENVLTFMLGAAPVAIAVYTVTDADPVNSKMIEGGVDFMVNNPVSFAAVAVGATSLLSITYELVLSPELVAFSSFLPFLQLRNIDVVILTCGLVSTFMFGAILGWPIEVIEWVGTGQQGDPPRKPGGRSCWGFKDIPKDLMWLVLAQPLAVYQAVEDFATTGNWVPLLFIPLQGAANAWSRVGDLVIDLASGGKIEKSILKDSWAVFDSLFKYMAGGAPVTSKISSTDPQPPVVDPYPNAYETYGGSGPIYNGSQFMLMPRFFMPGDNDALNGPQ